VNQCDYAVLAAFSLITFYNTEFETKVISLPKLIQYSKYYRSTNPFILLQNIHLA